MKPSLRVVCLLCAFLIATLPGSLTAQAHLTQLEILLADLLAHPSDVNQYGTPGHIDWSGEPRTAVSECSTLVTMTMKHTYGYSDSAYAAKTGGTSPNAALYYDNIVAGRSFSRVAGPATALAGDIIAVKYPAGEEASGHAMTVYAVAAWQARVSSAQTFLTASNYPEITGYYDVTVIDSTATFHGPSDTRANRPGGIGKGVVRFYVDHNMNVTGYTWSTVNDSVYYSPANSGHVAAFGRWLP
jgi:hypothetical protein